MDLVRGLPATGYCDQARVPIPDRLRLFTQVCRAVQHAHQKGVIHRDLKPSNVLVTVIDGTPVPKVIDFGIAKATGASLTERTLITVFHQLVGTPAYMFPEQAELSGVDVDTRSDVYSLGVLLYELLTGTTPFDPDTLRTAGLDEMRRIIREDEPPRPSHRLSTLKADARSTVAGKRGIDDRKLTRLLRGDLDWVVMKSLEKDRNRRYESASALAADVERYLAVEPVEARPPGTFYRLRKYAEARKQRDDANNAQAKETRQRITAETALGFMKEDLLLQMDPENQADAVRGLTGGFEVKENPTLRELLERAGTAIARDRIMKRFPDQPQVRAELLKCVGDAYVSIGEYENALDFLVRAVDDFKLAVGEDDLLTLNAMSNLALDFGYLDRNAEAAQLLERVLEAKKRTVGPEHADTLTTQANLALMCKRLETRLPEAITLFERTRDAQLRLFGDKDRSTINTQTNLCAAYLAAGRVQEAVEQLEAVKAVFDKEGLGDHPRAHRNLKELAVAYLQDGRIRNATALGERLWEAVQKYRRDDHPETIGSMNGLAESYIKARRPKQAIRTIEQVRDVLEAKCPDDPTKTFSVQNHLAVAYWSAGRRAEAVAMLERLRPEIEATLGPTDTSTITVLDNLQAVYLETGRTGQRTELLETLLKRMEARYGRADNRCLTAVTFLGVDYHQVKRWKEAIPYLEETIARGELKNGWSLALGLSRDRFDRMLCEDRPVREGGRPGETSTGKSPGDENDRQLFHDLSTVSVRTILARCRRAGRGGAVLPRDRDDLGNVPTRWVVTV
jgi:eukaryotic-like serine/threonine-protein kinase